MTLIAADVGGTKTHLAVAESNSACGIVHEAIYPSQQFSDFTPLLHTFLQDSGLKSSQLRSLSLALPGIVDTHQAKLTNLPWTIEKQALKDEFNLEEISFINDFQASASGISCLKNDDMITVYGGTINENGTRAVVGAGTGLGVAWAQKVAGHYTTYSTEGGHIDFAPTNEEQMGLLQYLMKSYRHVSYERLLSGGGLEAIYDYLKTTDEFAAGTGYTASDDGSQSARWIVEQAHAGYPVAYQAVTLFAEIYGAYVGNLALVFKPEGGIYITGGIAAKTQQWICSPAFINAYLSKGRMSNLVETIQVTLVTNESVGVLGAIAAAGQNPQE